MLTADVRELIHHEVDGVNAPEASAAARALIAQEPAAAVFAAELRQVNALLGRVAERVPPPQLKRAILDALPRRPRASPSTPTDAIRSVEPGVVSGTMHVQTVIQRALSQLSSVLQRMEEGVMSKKALIIGTTAVALVAIIGGAVIGYPPTGGESGTIGGGDAIAGVERASRYRGRTMSERDVTIANPEIAVLLQNPDVLTLVKSDVFRSAMANESFRSLQSNESFRSLMASDSYRALAASDSYRALMANDSYRALMSSDAYRSLEANESYRALMSNEASRNAMMSEAYRELANSDAYRAVQSNDAFRAVMANDSFRAVMANDAFRSAMSSDAFRAVMANDAFRAVMANDAFRSVMANDAFRSLQSSEAYRSLSRSAALSEVFMNEAMRSQQ